MTQPVKENTMLDREFLNIRCKILDIASALDRIDQHDNASITRSDPRMKKIMDALQSLTNQPVDRAQKIQMIFSDTYDPDWKS